MDKLDEIIDMTESLKCLRAQDRDLSNGELGIRTFYQDRSPKSFWEVPVELKLYAHKFFNERIAELENKRRVLFQQLTPDEQLELIDRGYKCG